MAVFVLGFRKPSVSAWWAVSVIFGINGVRKQPSHLVGPPVVYATKLSRFVR